MMLRVPLTLAAAVPTENQDLLRRRPLASLILERQQVLGVVPVVPPNPEGAAARHVDAEVCFFVRSSAVSSGVREHFSRSFKFILSCRHWKPPYLSGSDRLPAPPGLRPPRTAASALRVFASAPASFSRAPRIGLRRASASGGSTSKTQGGRKCFDE